ncbi:hypothetical protein [Xylanimonas ulmi]|uniref:Uncharacterized protein n=1 Tax=Xylanimonas ulmi TaxID=228973 RepID=A0A4Q7M5H3_9MICO|nr:hypothetical protein [Xylanibacterium ulmi]RZS62681.1 hypothetical protein EV386_3028 [Xylanibacterium ulmi]
MGLDLSAFAGILPYDSQLYGIHQPLLGWKSKVQKERLTRGLVSTRRSFLWAVAQRYRPEFSIESTVVDAPRYELGVASARPSVSATMIPGMDGLLTQNVVAAVAAGGGGDDAWRKYTSREYVTGALREIQEGIRQEFIGVYTATVDQHARAASAFQRQSLTAILTRESVAAGVLADFSDQKTPHELAQLFSPNVRQALDLPSVFGQLDPAESDLATAALSPIGVVHLFRQYFFELATFLGTPVQHVWLSPGGSVELIEVSTRRQILDRTIEQQSETTQKVETDTTNSDELSDAVKQENSSDTKLGVTASSNNNYNTGFINGSVNVSGSFNLDQQQKQAREQTHKTTRQQTSKLSSEIRQSYKSTLRTITDTTDMSSKRYVLQNTTDTLVNYELRRKMRQVGVQLQDYGTRLCWQAYVDNPGDDLGLPIFVHAAPPPDLQDLKVPEAPPAQPPLSRGDAIVVKGGWDHGDNRQDNFIPIGPPVSIVAPAGTVTDHLEVTLQQGPSWAYRAWPANAADTTVTIGTGPETTAGKDLIAQVGSSTDGTDETTVVQAFVGVQCGPGGLRDDAKYDITIQVTPVFRPSKASLKAVADAYNTAMTTYTEETKLAYQKSLFDSIRERVKLASGIQPRPFSELREEERVAVYRKLVGQLLEVAGVTTVDPHVRHVFSEVVESMFDMDSMLYFVAPDWWMPRNSVTSQQALAGLGVTSADDQGAYTPGNAANISGANVVGWGGARAVRSDNYFITEDSQPARLGSSLGWLVQLDGDNFRNAFLNAPWVKAVIPLQEGHEWKALGWLSSDSIEGADGLDAIYQEGAPSEVDGMLTALRAYAGWPSPDLGPRYAALAAADFTILDAIRYLIITIQGKQDAGLVKGAGLDYLPTDKVYENGFDPLTGGFVAKPSTPYEVFDQWIEVLPTDQIVPVEVAYDPKTGQQL